MTEIGFGREPDDFGMFRIRLSEKAVNRGGEACVLSDDLSLGRKGLGEKATLLAELSEGCEGCALLGDRQMRCLHPPLQAVHLLIDLSQAPFHAALETAASGSAQLDLSPCRGLELVALRLVGGGLRAQGIPRLPGFAEPLLERRASLTQPLAFLPVALGLGVEGVPALEQSAIAVLRALKLAQLPAAPDPSSPLLAEPARAISTFGPAAPRAPELHAEARLPGGQEKATLESEP